MSMTASQTEPSLMQKRETEAWFRTLRDQICAVFEEVEDALDSDRDPAGRFASKTWLRDGGGGGEMSPRMAEFLKR